MRPAALLGLALAALAATPGAAGSGLRQIVYVEETATYQGGGALAPGEATAFRFKVVEENVTGVTFRVRWLPETGATFSLAVLDPFGHPVASPVALAPGAASLDAGEVAPRPPPQAVPEEGLADALAEAASRAGRGEWRVSVRAGEDAQGPVSFSVDVTVASYRAVVLSVVTLQAAPSAGPRFWALVLVPLASAVAALGLALALPGKRSVSPSGDNTPSLAPEQERVRRSGDGQTLISGGGVDGACAARPRRTIFRRS